MPCVVLFCVVLHCLLFTHTLHRSLLFKPNDVVFFLFDLKTGLPISHPKAFTEFDPGPLLPSPAVAMCSLPSVRARLLNYDQGEAHMLANATPYADQRAQARVKTGCAHVCQRMCPNA